MIYLFSSNKFQKFLFLLIKVLIYFEGQSNMPKTLILLVLEKISTQILIAYQYVPITTISSHCTNLEGTS